MNNKVIAIISVLKPVDDPRNYEKIATSLGNTNKYEINIIGFKSKNIPISSAVTFHPEFDFDRSNVKRWLASVKIWQKFIILKPELIIVTCAELLAVTCLYKILFGCRIVYDVQENYFRNFIYSGAYPPVIKYPAAVFVRLLEYATSPLIDAFFLAERVYERQLHFIKRRFITIENKTALPGDLKNRSKNQGDKLRFLYCGTITRHYGVLEAISFFKGLQNLIPHIQLTIHGHSPDIHFFAEVQRAANGIPSIQIIGKGDLIPHKDILKEMLSAHFVLMPYHSGRSVEGRIPTKLYECLAMEIPVIISPNSAWLHLVNDNNAGIIHDFKCKPDSEVISRMLAYSFFGKHTTNTFLWASCEKALLTQIHTVLTN